MKLDVVNRVETMELVFQNYIEQPPVKKDDLYRQACSADTQTLGAWEKIWIDNIRENKKTFGSFKEMSIAEIFGRNQYQTVIIAGSGPSLSYNGDLLKDRGNITLVSCLHNFHFFEDRDVDVDYYVSLDAGDITIEEVSEGGQNSEDFYWERTKDKTLLCFIGTSPRLLARWQGRIFFFNAPVPNKEYELKQDEIEVFNTYVSNGGNVLGACFYIAKGLLGASTIAFVGADFSFSYKNKFHGWDSKYDKNLGTVLRAIDIYGNKALTWQSYYNFKCWFDWVTQAVPGVYINCTEGGIFGSYPEGNLITVRQMHLSQFLNMVNMNKLIEESVVHPETAEKKILF
jgi:hypothetical protein